MHDYLVMESLEHTPGGGRNLDFFFEYLQNLRVKELAEEMLKAPEIERRVAAFLELHHLCTDGISTTVRQAAAEKLAA
jgi:hypothetical protein